MGLLQGLREEGRMSEQGCGVTPNDAVELDTGLVARLRAWWLGVRERQRLRDEFASLEGQGQLDSVLQEVGATRGAIGAILRAHPAAPKRLTVMLRRLGISRERLRDSGALHDVEMTCTVCEATGECEHWLRAGKTDGYQGFCPNAPTLESLRSGKAPS
jgi:Family of unknown function (DUF6455)